MSFYSDKQLNNLVDIYEKMPEKHFELTVKFHQYNFSNEIAKEYALQGFSRRMDTLKLCIENVYSFLPPDISDVPSRLSNHNATINIQAFIFNVFGCLDNLAHMWIKETNLRVNGREIPRRHIGLRRNNKSVRESFSKSFQNYLNDLESWFVALIDLRDSLAHRIPVYIPPNGVNERDEKEYQELHEQLHNFPYLEGFDKDAHDSIHKQISGLEFFQPIMLHSWNESTDRIAFHTQILYDHCKLVEIGHHLVNELVNYSENHS